MHVVDVRLQFWPLTGNAGVERHVFAASGLKSSPVTQVHCKQQEQYLMWASAHSDSAQTWAIAHVNSELLLRQLLLEQENKALKWRPSFLNTHLYLDTTDIC